MKAESIDHAYASGFVEADGCIYLNGASCSVRVTNRNPSVLEWFMNTYGGVTRSKVVPPGCYEWVLHSERASEFLKLIKPHMKFKKNQVDLAIQFQALKGIRGRKISSEVLNMRKEILQKLKDEKAQWRSSNNEG